MTDQVTWAVQSVTPTTKFQQGEGPKEGYDVFFLTNTGLNGSVFVPKAAISNTAAVANTIATEVTHLVSLHTLTG